jgi:hypothetical protein
MMELKEAIEIFKTYNLAYSNEIELKEAIKTILSFLSKIQDAEMPQKKEIPSDKDICLASPDENYSCGYNQCHDDFLAYHLRKVGERVDVERIERIILDVSDYDEITHFPEVWRKKVAQAIAKELRGEK